MDESPEAEQLEKYAQPQSLVLIVIGFVALSVFVDYF